MDAETVFAAIQILKKMPDNAAASAAAAAESATAAQEAADTVTSATVVETEAYLNIS